MKRLIFVSTFHQRYGDTGFSNQLMDIFMASRVKNRERAISGVLVVCGESVLQVMEGESEDIAFMLFKIKKDDRHSNLTVVSNTSIHDRSFKSWSMRSSAVPLPEDNKINQKIVPMLRPELKQHLPHQDLSRIRQVISFDINTAQRTTPQPTENPLSTRNKQLAITQGNIVLKSWPKPRDLRLDNILLKLCGHLLGKRTSYNALCAKESAISPDTILKYLHKLYELDLLVVETANTGLPAAYDRKPDRFSGALRKLLASLS